MSFEVKCVEMAEKKISFAFFNLAMGWVKSLFEVLGFCSSEKRFSYDSDYLVL